MEGAWPLLLFLVASLQFYVFAENRGTPPMVTLRTGAVAEGFRVTTPLGAAANVFLGMPYAQSPIGPLRFKKPKPLHSQPSRISCTAYKPSCWQNHSNIENPITDLSEDCLYLNIFAGFECQNTSKCPVVYYIHGGAFEFDSPSLFPVETLVENFAANDLVFITVAYRLGVMGFWGLGGEEVIGNYALHDMIQGLRWVQQEIEAFGGDPGRVTIMGQSAGAAAVSLLTLTSETEGLFHAAIMLSGNAVLNKDLNRHRRLAEDVGCAKKLAWFSDHKYDTNILECMQNVPVDHLVSKYRWFEDTDATPPGVWSHSSPLLDGPNGLFPASLPELMKTNRRPVNIMIGATKNEMGSQIESHLNATASTVAELCKAYISAMSVTRNRNALTLQCQRHYAGSALQELQSKNRGQQDEKFSVWAVKSVEINNDFQFFAPIFKEATSFASAGAKVYLYSFDYVKTGLEGIAPWHSFDMAFLIGLHPFQFDDRDIAIKSSYVPLFVNFAKFGNPTPHPLDENIWIPLRTPPTDMNYFSVDLPKPTMKKGYHYDGVLFWNYIVPSFGGGTQSASSHGSFLNTIAKNGLGIEANEVKNKDVGDWSWAFWTTLFVIIFIFLIIGVTAVRRKPRTWSRTRNWHFHVKKQKNAEEEELLLSTKNADSYSSIS